MTFLRYNTPRGEPFYWWGPATEPRQQLSLVELVRRNSVTPQTAAFLATAVAFGVSIVVISERSGEGKSTLLAAILRAGAVNRDVVYVRGNYETFDFLATFDRAAGLIAVNEISAHLPVYLWGGAVARLFEVASSGAQIVATGHAAEPRSFIHLLTEPPLRVPVQYVSAPKLMVTMRQSPTNGIRVHAVHAVAPGSSDYSTQLEPIHIEAGCGNLPGFRVAGAAVVFDALGIDASAFARETDQFRQRFLCEPWSAFDPSQ